VRLHFLFPPRLRGGWPSESEVGWGSRPLRTKEDPHPALPEDGEGKTNFSAPALPEVGPKSAREQAYFSGSANTHSIEPPSGLLISGVSVPNDRSRPDPLPLATATYCLPLTL
jgi:hypothetical protein